MTQPAPRPAVPDRGTRIEVFAAFLKLGLCCFGGPIAHLAYFREEFVVRRRWLDEEAYADLVGLCQFLPGPASSQVGFSLGMMRAGYLGGLAAWVGFTLPSALLLFGFAVIADILSGPVEAGLVHGLKLVAVAIVAQAVWGMSRSLCPDRARASVAVAAALPCLLASSAPAQIAAIGLGAIAGSLLCRSGPQAASPARRIAMPVSRPVALAALATLLVLLVGLPILGESVSGAAFVEAFYRSGALVFGGGHVVLPLLREAFVGPGWIGDDVFLAGYGAAQAVPGPLFSVAAYLGAVAAPPSHALLGAAVGLVAIFLPGILILLGALPFWEALRQREQAQAMVRGVNAAVVGILAAALYTPLWTSSVTAAGDFGLALVCFVLLTVWRAPPLVVVAIGAAGGIVLTQPL